MPHNNINSSNIRTALVTGASRGIGRAIAIALATSGYNIAGIARSLGSDESTVGLVGLRAEIESYGVEYLPLQLDIADIGKHESAVSSVINKFGQIDLLVNNAGIAPAERKDILDTTIGSYDEVMDINLKGTFFLTQLVSNIMAGQKPRNTYGSQTVGGSDPKNNDYCPRIIFITSISAELSSTNRAEYCISKAGLSMVSRLFADRLAGEGINVFEVRPGIIKTDMTADVTDKYDRLIADGLIPQRRWGQPEDIAKVVAAISEGNFDYSTGSIIEISGGMNIGRL